MVTIWCSAVVSHHLDHTEQLTTVFATSKNHTAHFFAFFSSHKPGDPFKERESPMIKDDQGGSIRRELRAKMVDAILHSRHTTTFTTPLAFKSLSSRWNQKSDSFHGLKLYTLVGGFSTVRLKYKFPQEMSVNLGARATSRLKSFSNSLLNGRFRGPIKSNGGH